MHKKLFIPGPTEVRKEILDAQATPMFGHRSKDFSTLYERIINKLKQVLNTKNHIIVFTSSGTGVMEGAIRNCVADKVLVCTNGAFSERWFDIAKNCGKAAEQVSVDWGKAVKPEMIEARLKQQKYDAVALVQNETSTGVRAPIEEIGEMMKAYPDTLLLVDCVSSLGGDKIEIDKIGIDVCITSAQKCFALPPGLAIGVISDRALEKSKKMEGKGYYFDFVAYLDYYAKNRQTPTTPAISLMVALDKELDYMLAEGMENRYRRHLEMANYVRAWAKKYFALFPEPGYESVTVSTIVNTRNIDFAALNKELGNRGMTISDGYGKLKGKTFRVAHMGDLTMNDISELIRNINDILGLQ